jgi:hypothetical protein
MASRDDSSRHKATDSAAFSLLSSAFVAYCRDTRVTL